MLGHRWDPWPALLSTLIENFDITRCFKIWNRSLHRYWRRILETVCVGDRCLHKISVAKRKSYQHNYSATNILKLSPTLRCQQHNWVLAHNNIFRRKLIINALMNIVFSKRKISRMKAVGPLLKRFYSSNSSVNRTYW